LFNRIAENRNEAQNDLVNGEIHRRLALAISKQIFDDLKGKTKI
jgi:hypothetical protein